MLIRERKIKDKTKQATMQNIKHRINNKEDENKMKNKGISLITLVITIIIMIIIAGVIVLTLSSSGIFDKANDAVSQSNLKQVQSLADVAWAEAYLDEKITTNEQYDEYVRGKLEDNKVKLEDYYIEVDKEGVTIEAPDKEKPTVTIVGNSEAIGTGETITYVITFTDNKKIGTINLTEENITLNGFTATKEIAGEGNARTITLSNVQGEIGAGKTITLSAGIAKDNSGNESIATTSPAFTLEKVELKLGNVVTPLDFGKSINYESDNGVTGWKVFYKTDKYVYIIPNEILAGDKLSDELLGVTAGTSYLFSEHQEYAISSVPESKEIVYPELDMDVLSEKWMAKLDSYTVTDISKNNISITTPFLLTEAYWTGLLNTNDYKNENGESYVLGSIGGPTLEIFAASWNEKRKATIDKGEEDIYTADIVLTKSNNGLYYDITAPDLTIDSLYVPTIPGDAPTSGSMGGNMPQCTMIASIINTDTSGTSGTDIANGTAWYSGGFIRKRLYFKEAFILPMVCLSADIPVEIDADGNYII